MAITRKPRKQDAQLAFEAISIEGGLLHPEWLARVAQLQAAHQTEADYAVPKGLNLRDEIGRYWRMAQAHWVDFEAGLTAGVDTRALTERFVLALLRDSLGFATLAPIAPVQVGDRTFPIGCAAHGGRVPVVIAPTGLGLETAVPELCDGGRRRSAFGLAQEYLNAVDEALWGIVSDGKTLRILRDNASLTRPAWVEADLARIFTEGRYADFAALWLLAHASRFGKPGQPATDCPLEVWREAGREQGTRARAKLRGGVEDALVALGQGFLSHPDNQALLGDLASGALTTKDYFNQLLRLVYRLIFLLTVEERDLLHPKDAAEQAKELYAKGYGMRRLRERAVKRSAHDRYGDLWEATKIVFKGLGAGEPRLGLPALAGIFAPDQCAALDRSKLANSALLLAVWKLAWLKTDGLERVNWRDMGPEELGSVYESLLELVPQISAGRNFGFAQGGETKGNARKTSGSYYTPDSLVQVLLDSALDPVIADTIAKHPENPVDALLGMSIVDPACGSGHFLLAAARRLAAHVARLQAGGTPSATQYRHALRQVVGRCVYGVDLNPMAVELCRVSLWMEAVEPGRPLSFLDSHIQQGNALLGTTPELMAKGIPDVAWEPIEGDDKKTASALKKRNKAERADKNASFEFSPTAEGGTIALATQVQTLDAAPDNNLGELARKGKTWVELLDSQLYQARRLAADAWCAAFVWPKLPGELTTVAPTHKEWERLRHEPQLASPVLVAEVRTLAKLYGFFHWHIQFPQVFAKGGFDVVLGNPPWERVKLQEQEFFAERSPEIAGAVNAAARKKLIAALPTEQPSLWRDWCEASRRAEGESHLIRQSGRYPLCGQGDVNTYAIFAEHNRAALRPSGRAGFITPTGIATDDTTKEFFAAMVNGHQLARFLHFENEEFVFPSVHHAFKFALLVVDASGQSRSADLVFFARQVASLGDSARHVSLTPEDFVVLNPNTRTCPTFRSRRDADINLAIYRRAGVLWDEGRDEGNPWTLRFLRMLDMANDSGSFRTRSELESSGCRLGGARFVGPKGEFLPLVEAKMVRHFDHRFGTYEGQTQAQENQGKLPELDDQAHGDPSRLAHPYYWVAASEVVERLSGRWDRGWLLGWRDICRSTDQRTVIASLIPRVAVGHKFPLALPSAEPGLVACLYGSLCSYTLDYAARQKVGGTSLTYFIVKQLPVLPPTTYTADTPWHQGTTLRDFILPRVLELTYTAWDLEPFAHDIGFEGPPFRWDPERRFLLRAELDAAFFHLYGISRDDADYILDTFPIVRKNDEKAHGEYRTKRAILEIYDAMAEAARTGKPYQTRLDPAPADRSVAHAPRPGMLGSPADDYRLIPDAEWARPCSDDESEAAAAIAAILKKLGQPRPSREVRLAATAALAPHILLPILSPAQEATWRRLVGGELAPAPAGVARLVPPVDRSWGAAVRHLRGNGLLVEDLAAKTWAPGSGLTSMDLEGWPEGRARFVLEVIQQRGEQGMLEAMPDALKRWIDAAAA